MPDLRTNYLTRAATVVALLVVAAVAPARPVLGAEDWNDKEITWKSYEDGLAAAKKEKKPICLIFYTEWCPHCQHYSGVFHDAKVVEMSKKFVMIRLDADKNQQLGDQYALDGKYIPRTFFLTSNGQVDGEITAAGRDKFKYFYDENNPSSVLASMDVALKKLQ